MASGSSSGESKDSRWYFTAEQLANSPSRKCGIEPDTELNFRQQAANLIQCVGQKVQVSQLCINTAIVYMHRFYAFHSFTHFHKNGIAQASLFLAAKVEEQPRKLEHVIKEACKCLHNGEPSKPVYEELALDLVFNENVLLQTLGFDVAIDHPHTHVVKTCHLVKASKDLAQTSYFLASNSLHLTTMCLQYRPQVVACFCIHLACRWSRWEIPPSNEKKDWFQYVDKTVTMELLQKLTEEFLYIFDKCPSRLKNKINSMRIEDPPTGSSQLLEGSSSGQSSHHHSSSSSSSSRHHHSSSHHTSSKVPHSEHHSSKSVSGSGAPDHKPHSIPSSSSSNVNRTRGERPVPPQNSSYVPTITQQHPPHSSSSNNSISSSNSKTILPNTHSTSNGRPVSSSNSSSQKLSHPLSDGSGYSSKNRSVIGGNQSMPYGHNQKLDQRHLLKDNMPANIKQEYKMQQAAELNKGPINKADPTALYLSGSRSETKNNPKQQQIPQQQQPFNMSTNQSASQMSRNQYNMPIENPPPSTQKLPAESSYKSLDESSRATTEAMQSTPPKQSKLTSIFSPDYKDASIIMPASFGIQPPPTSSNSSSSRNNLMATNLKMNKDSPNKKQSYSSSYDRKLDTPSKKEKKLLLQQQHQQLQQQQQQEAALNSISRGSSSSNAMDKKLNPNLSSSSNSINPKKTQNESTGNLNLHTGNSQQSSFISSFEPVVTNKVPTIQNNAPKRPFMDLALSGSSSLDDVVDSRENKIRKLDLDMMDRISPGSKINESKHSMNLYDVMYNTEKSNSKTFVNTVNGIETNPALVSSLLKEMCTDSNKYGTALNASVTQTDFTTNMSLQPPLELLQPKIEPKDEPMSPIELTATLPQQILQPPPQQTYQHHQIQMQQQIPVQQMQPQQHLPQIQQQQPPPIIQQPTIVAPTPAPQQIAAVSTFVAPVATAPVSNADSDEFHRSKSEKKKKKDKHKHKEKDKSKDREERKKHKKDKDKHKDRHEKKSSPHSEASVDQTAAFETQSRIKITIPKEKINFGNTDLNTNTSFKIKIPKDRIKTELSGASSSSINQYNDNSSNTVQQGQQQSQPPPTNSLKIKISKDVLENYNSSTYSHDNQTSHHSSKKKDRDRDREKSKCNKSDSSKQNYNGNGNSNNNNNNTSSGNSGQSMNRSSSNQNKNLPSYKNNSQYSSQHHQYSSSGSSYSRSHQQDANNKLNNNFYYPNNNRVSNNSSTSSTK